MKILSIISTGILLGLFCVPSFAGTPDQFTGTWKGKGTYIYDGDLTQCGGFEMVFSGESGSFSFVSGSRICEKHSEEFYQVTMQYRNGKLYFGGAEVGSYKDNMLIAEFSAPDGDGFRHWRMFMRKEGNHLMYEESRTMNDEKTPLISFAGLLILED